jgi:hypothetical protein
MPIAIVTYPNAHVVIGCGTSACPSTGIDLRLDYWTVAGFDAIASDAAFATGLNAQSAGTSFAFNGPSTPSHGQRIVGNRVTSGYYGIGLNTSVDSQFLGNEVANTPHSGIYYGGYGPGQNLEIAWNVVHDIGAEGFGIKAYGHTPADTLGGLTIHDNLVYNTGRAPILIGGSDGHVPWIKDAAIYNNVIYAFQMQPGGGNEGAIRIGNAGLDASGESLLAATILENTIVLDDPLEATALENDGCKNLLVENNLFVQASGPIWAAPPGAGALTMDHNLYFGTAAATEDTHPITQDPLFVDHAGHDFHLRSGSPARDVGVSTTVTTDFDGTLRPQGSGFDVGAYEATP